MTERKRITLVLDASQEDHGLVCDALLSRSALFGTARPVALSSEDAVAAREVLEGALHDIADGCDHPDEVAQEALDQADAAARGAAGTA